MTEWYYAQGGQQTGPVAFERLVELARKGALDPAKDLVWTSTMKDWIPAGKVEGLFSAAPETPDLAAADPSNPYSAPQSSWVEPVPGPGVGLAEIIHGSEPIDLGACVKRGFDLTKRQFGIILLVGLVYVGISIGASVVLGLVDSALGWGSRTVSYDFPGNPTSSGGTYNQFMEFQQNGSIPNAILTQVLSDVRFLRPPPRPHRILPARWHDPHQGSGQTRRGTRHARRGHDRPRQPLRSHRVLPELQKAGVKPIFGCEIYLAPQSMEDKKGPGRPQARHPHDLLAETNEGWNNLSKLVSKGHLEGLYYGKPRVDRETLRQFSKGIICLTGCISGPVNEWLLAGDEDKARETLAELVDIYGKENTYVEIHNHGLEPQRRSPRTAEARRGVRPQAGRRQRRAFPHRVRPRGARRDDLHRHRPPAHR
jgi:hypothetical protein